ncbi:hypothetical protein [Bacillus sp. RAR_GA_16]|uniref:hypothetical protein n=1 Tax=Bacillus sp. RAR_GA_16 TaxID=2876774 RepID=UPI001CCE684E|nr:hypothetical protein [Bacillus sp. RAR_GA_16]MCA0174519.1 hypothetical protein [Bacillus sp. RAR_GA_16]
MSEKKRKPQVIHVNKLIVKANEVIIQDEREHHHKEEKHREERREERREEKREERRDPWGFFNHRKNDETENNEDRYKEEDKGQGFSWF